jgi:hypothetical protein
MIAQELEFNGILIILHYSSYKKTVGGIGMLHVLVLIILILGLIGMLGMIGSFDGG